MKSLLPRTHTGDEMNKRCSRCKTHKLLELFDRNKNYKDGRFSWCKQCRKNWRKEKTEQISNYNRLEYLRNRERLLSYRKQYFQTLKGKFAQYKQGAKSRKIVWALTFEQFALFWQKPCMYCGDSISTIGLDRVNTTQGYNFENIVACCAVCNKMKHAYSSELFINHCLKITEKQNLKKF